MSSTSRDMRELSKVKWSTTDTEYAAINCGSMMRIADATEIMAKNYVHLQDNRDRYKELYLQEQKTASALRGVITKLKKAAREVA